MIQNVLRAMGGVEVYGIISVCLFFLVFTTAIVWALLQKKSLLQTMSALPLEEECNDSVDRGDKLSSAKPVASGVSRIILNSDEETRANSRSLLQPAQGGHQP